MDRITQSYLREFLTLQDIRPKSDSLDFEKFVNYSIVSKEYNGEFKIEDISTGEAQGVDGIAIIVNGRLVTSVEEIDDLSNLNRYLEVTYLFIQSKTSSAFNGNDMGMFAITVKELFQERPSIVLNSELRHAHKLIQHIYDLSPKMTRGKPKLKLYYVTTGIWVDDQNLLAIIDNGCKDLATLNLFSNVSFEPCDGSQIQSYYNKTKEGVSATFVFRDKVTLPDAEGITEAYFGLLPYEEFLKVICDENRQIKNIFSDNIRDFLGDNPVNDKIAATINLGKFDFFSVLNNGITVVATTLTSSGNRFSISDYQIVNGCQTSHVLYSNRNVQGIEKVTIPFRLIATDKDEIKNEITVATNSQTAIKPEQLEALSGFQKGLEQYYNTFAGDGRLYYERRTNQYSTDDTIPKIKIISIPTQIKAFASMFLDLPHQVSRYYGTIVNNVGEQFFKQDHKYAPYYVSAYALYRLEYYFRSNNIDPKYRKCKFHLLTIFRRISNSADLPNFNSSKIEGYCTKIITILNDSSLCLSYFIEATKVIDNSGYDINDADTFKQKDVAANLQ
ncbi:AIPR protein [Sporomusa ovata DSM 2662]|uniref:Abortive phage infection protein C-terminal domain-containing protein n=1 Tax=Sporomusa ovata TaxID=2378 RepID=A0A0U1L0F5_9FIRM|nr:AIPR family protein [Sporomusa ovata]EQB27304.1 AIPR protein [Sporomusa ovata DSM 2662]CQR73146.1 hypothetical protein SpAn4DRAFT_2378 [Sporomusa ovata]